MSSKIKANRLLSVGSPVVYYLMFVLIVLVAALLTKVIKVEQRQAIVQTSGPLAASKEGIIKVEQREPVQILQHLTSQEASFPEPQRWGNRFLVSETFKHRVLVFDAHTYQLIKEFKAVGSGELEFHYPRTVRADKEGNWYILEEGNKRVQIISPHNTFLTAIPLDYLSFGLAVGNSENIYLSQPQREALISVFRRDGKLVGSFGDLKGASQVFGPQYKQYDDSHRLPLNLASLDSDAGEHIYLAFTHLPILQKYRRDGTLVWEKRLKGPGIEWLEAALWNPPKEPGLLKFNVFRVVLVIVIKGISYDPVRGVIALLLGDDTIWILNSDGDVLKVVEVPGYNKRDSSRKHNKAFWKLSMYEGTIYLSSVYSELFSLTVAP
jgi:hypothetical protein